MATGSQTLRARQVASVEKILNLNSSDPKRDPQESTDGIGGHTSNAQTTAILNSEGVPVWKILVFDGECLETASAVILSQYHADTVLQALGGMSSAVCSESTTFEHGASQYTCPSTQPDT